MKPARSFRNTLSASSLEIDASWKPPVMSARCSPALIIAVIDSLLAEPGRPVSRHSRRKYGEYASAVAKQKRTRPSSGRR